MTVLSDLERDVVSEITDAKRRQSAIEAVRYLSDQLGTLKFAPEIALEKDGECLVLRLDLFSWQGVDLAKGADETVTFEVPADKFPAKPEPDAPAASEQPEPCSPEGEPTPLITGPFSVDEKQVIVDMVVGGSTPSEIGNALDRAVGSINVMCTHLKADIAAAHETQKRPKAIETKPKAQPVASDHPGLTVSEREILIHLNAVGHVAPWTAAKDLDMAEGLSRGDGAGNVAEALECAKADVVARWKLLNTNPGAIDHQARLLRVLRLRARSTVKE